MNRFWSSSDNKVNFQQAFIKWMTSNGQSDVLVYLGGANTEDITSCIQVWRGETIRVPSLKNDHEEADDRIFYHLNHSIKDDGFHKVFIASADTDVFICAIYHFNKWVYCGLKEMWFISRKSGSLAPFPNHQLTE